jgi:hypothetical protein
MKYYGGGDLSAVIELQKKKNKPFEQEFVCIALL